ncbi:MAG: hypothetical protein HY222_05025 [Thaumarchaeota archaeon]|nr:hypothetical protein [Nitrososphaerota archaeon]MBI3641738.1 hypothetical protein [Nitrososphaerota archaeon]
MKTLHLGLIIFLFVLVQILPQTVFAFQAIHDTSNPIVTPKQIKFNAIDDIIGPSGPILTAQLNKLNYEMTDTPIINISGPPSSTLNLVILDSSGKEMHSDKISVGPDGLATYSINLTSFTPGLYSVVISRENIKVVKDFAVGLSTSGPRIDLLVPKPSYIPNEILQITGFYQPNTIIHLDLIDPKNIIKNSTLLQSDYLGNFQKKFVVPSDAVNGTEN